MKKNIFQLILVLMFTMPAVMMAQTVEIDSVTQPPGDILVQVDMNSFTGGNGNVAAITLTIEYDSDLMSFVSIENIHASFTGTWNAHYSSSTDQLVITYMAPIGAGHDINGKLLDIKFDYLGGFSTDVIFDINGCEIADNDLQIISASYINGFVEQSPAVGTVSMDDLTEPIGNTVNMPVTIIGTGFGAVDAITLKVAYDETQLTYAGIVEDAITGVIANAAGGVLTLNWTGGPLNFTALDTLLNIQFVYYGGNADVEFIPGCEISGGLTMLATDYVDGSVDPTPQSASLTIQSVSGPAGIPVNIPIVADDIIQPAVGSIALNISYGDSLTYTGFTANQLSGWVVNGNVNGVITIEWSSTGGSPITDGDLITLNFNYTSGIALIEFDPGCELKTTNLVTIPVTFNDGVIGAYTISGVLKYANTGAIRPLVNSVVYLKSTGGAIIDQKTSDASGNYEFTGVLPGSYLLDASTTIDAQYSYDLTDAYIIFGIGSTLTGLKALAGDVNQVGGVDVTDAYIVYGSWASGNVKVPAWIAPDWIFENPTIIVVSSNVSQDISGICSGDVNTSFIP